MKSCTIITCKNCEFYNTQYCKNCSKEGNDCYEHWEWRHDVSWRQEQIDNLTKQISDLETKLAESEKSKEINIKERDKICLEMATDYNRQILELKQQLAEKDKTIENLRIDLKDYQDLEEKISTKYDKVVEKFAESEKRIQAYEKIVEQKDEEISFANRDKTCIVKQLNDPKDYVLLEDYKKLEQQLADTEAQNKRVLEKLDLIVRSNQELEKENEVMAKTLRMTKCIEKEINQDKISFAVEQLEKVKDYAQHTQGGLINYIDNQIKQLKEGK